MLACIFATNGNCATSDCPLRWTLEWQSNKNPNKRQVADGHCWPRQTCTLWALSLSQVTLRIAKWALNQNPWLQSLLRSLANHERTKRDLVALPLKPFRTGVDTNMSTQTLSSTLGTGMSPAIALQSDATRASLPRPPTLYKATNSRTMIVSHANGDGGSFRTYSHIPLHLWNNALDRTETNNQTKVRSSKNTAHSGKVKADITVKRPKLYAKSILQPDSCNWFTQ